MEAYHPVPWEEVDLSSYGVEDRDLGEVLVLLDPCSCVDLAPSCEEVEDLSYSSYVGVVVHRVHLGEASRASYAVEEDHHDPWVLAVDQVHPAYSFHEVDLIQEVVLVPAASVVASVVAVAAAATAVEAFHYPWVKVEH